MTYLSDIVTTPSELLLDAFGRSRVSTPGHRLEAEFIYDLQPKLFDAWVSGGSASVTHNANGRDVTLLVGSTVDTEHATLASHPVPYTPANSLQPFWTGVFDLAGLGTGTVECFLRSNVSGTPTDLRVIPQANWDAHTSGLNWSKSHVLGIDFQSLKVGRIRFIIDTAGTPTLLTSIYNDNLYNTGFWNTPTLPMTYRIYNTATETIAEMAYGNEQDAIGFRWRAPRNAAASMKAICCAVQSEGGPDLIDIPGFHRVADTGVTRVAVAATLVPMVSIRAKSTFNGLPNLGVILPTGAYVETNEPIRLVVVHDAVLTGAVWGDVGANSCVEFDMTATAIAGGHEEYADYLWAQSGANRASASTSPFALSRTPHWVRRDPTNFSGIVSLCAIATSANSATVLAGLRWKELR